MAKSILNIQDSFLNQARKDKVGITVHLLDGSTLRGKITAFDNFTMIIANDNEDEQNLVYKHSIATMTPENKVRWNIAGGPRDERGDRDMRDRDPRDRDLRDRDPRDRDLRDRDPRDRDPRDRDRVPYRRDRGYDR